MPGNSLLLPVVLSLLAATSSVFPSRPNWRRLAPGLEFARWRTTRYDSLTRTGFCRMGEPYVASLRIDPTRYRFEMFHHSQLDSARDLPDAGGWQEWTRARVVFNAGQYYPDLSYMGLFVSRARRFGPRLHPQWQAVFAAEPTGSGLPRARIYDLRYDRFDPASTSYTQLAQSFMLFDRTGRRRVKQGDWTANRTVIAQDRQGRILVFVSEGGYTLWDFARLLQTGGLGLVKAMSLDGGYEAELAVRVRRFEYATYGQWETNDCGDLSLPGIRLGLPAVIAVFAR